MMRNDKKNGRPIANNVDYFPHKCKDDKELRFIQHKYKSEGYEVFYRLQQCLGDAESHRIDLGNDIERQMFEMSMSVNKEVVYGVIDILVEMNWLDKELYQKEKVLWSDKFIFSIKLGNPCEMCGESDPIVLEFDHIDPKTKSHNVSEMVKLGYSIKSIINEVEKCRLLCANCHRRVTAKDFSYFSHQKTQEI